MEGERILQCILRGDARLLQNLQNYIAPLQKLLDSDVVNCAGKKAVECEEIICKYGIFCTKLLRYCIEALQKKQGSEPEECFEYSELGADMLSKLVRKGVKLPTNISIAGIVKLLFHLIISALKEGNYTHLSSLSTCLIDITRETCNLEEDNKCKDVPSICKQTSDHLWNAAIKLEQSNSLEREERAAIALSLRKNSLFLLSVTKPALSLIIERGLKAARQFQQSCADTEVLRKFLFGLLGKAIALMNFMKSKKSALKEGDYCLLEDLCISCCKTAVNVTHFNELLEYFPRLIKDKKNNAACQGRLRVFQTVIQMLLCGLCFCLKAKKLANQKLDDDAKWSTLQKQLTNITENMKDLDYKLYVASQMIQAVDYLRSACSKLLNKTTADTTGKDSDKISQDTLSAIVNVFLVCFNMQGYVVKSRKQNASQLISNCSYWKQTVYPRLSMLYLIGSLILRGVRDHPTKVPQNSRKVAICEYVAAMSEAKTLIDAMVEDVTMATDHYRYLATDAFNVGLTFFKNNQLNDATALARLSCEAADAWFLKQSATNGLHEALLYKKYELLSDCLEKKNDCEGSLRAMNRCCQVYALSKADFCEYGATDNKALECVDKWTTRKHHFVKQLGDGKHASKVKRCNLRDGWDTLDGEVSNEKKLCILLRMELDSYRRKRYFTDDEEIAVIEELLKVFDRKKDHLNVCSIKLEKVKVVYHMNAQCHRENMDVSQCLETCEQIIRDLNELVEHDQDSLVAKDVLASSYFWRFLLQYLRAVGQADKDSTRKVVREETDDEEHSETEVTQDTYQVASLKLFPHFVPSLHSAVNIWTEMVNYMVGSDEKADLLSQSQMCWSLQIASSVYGFLNMPFLRIHTLSVLSAAARVLGGNENLQTIIVANSLAIQMLCEEGNAQSAELLSRQSEGILESLGEDCRPATRCLFCIAKSYLLLARGIYDDGWKLLKDVLRESQDSKKSVFQLVVLKAKLLCWRYVSLPSRLWKPPVQDLGYIQLEFLLNSLRRAEALIEYFVGDDADQITNLVEVNQRKEQDGILLSHWSVVNELSCCLMETGKVFLLQGAVREARRYLEDGMNVAMKFISPSRLSEFAIQLVQLNLLKGEMNLSEMFLKQVFEILRPGVSLHYIAEKPEMFELSHDMENSPFNIYDEIVPVKLHLKVLGCFCQYLMRMERTSDVRTVIHFLRDLRERLMERCQMAFKSLERVFNAEDREKCCRSNEPLQPAGRENTKAKGRKGKTTSKYNKTKTSEFPLEKPQAASIAFIESGLKILGLESDMSLFEGDFASLLSTVQEGLELVKRAQQFPASLVQSDVTSTSLLYYLRGVAHVLSSKVGFDSWRVAGFVLPSFGPNETGDVEDISAVMSRLEISATVVEACDEGQCEENHTFMQQLLKEPWSDLDSDESYKSMKARPRVSRGCKAEAAKDPAKSPKKTTRSRKGSSKKNVIAVQETVTSSVAVGNGLGELSESVQEDAPSKKNSKNTRKKSRSAKKNDVAVEEPLVKSEKKKRSTSRKNNSSSNVQGGECKKAPLSRNQIAVHRRFKKVSPVFDDDCTRNGAVVVEGKLDGSASATDEGITKALQCFHLSLEYLHPCYNPILLTRICHALVLCYGSRSPVNATIYHNLPLATTLRHQAMLSSAKKIRKIKDELSIDEGDEHDQLVKSYGSMKLDDSCQVKFNKLSHLSTIQNVLGFKTSIEELSKSFEYFMDLLPRDWTVCKLSLIPAPEREKLKHLLVSRLRKKEEPVVLKLTLPNTGDEEHGMEDDFETGDSVVRHLFRGNILDDFEEIFRESHQSMELKDKRDWWNRRREIDDKLQILVQRLEDTWFGKWRGILCGRLLEKENSQQLKANLEELQKKASKIFGAPVKNEQLLEVLVEGYPYLKLPEVACALAELTGMEKNSEQVIKFCSTLKQSMARNSDSNTSSPSRGPVILILDKAIQHLPFESMPILREQEVSRMPSLDFITSHLSLQTMKTPAPVDTLTTGVDIRKTFYVLNPKKDLKKTEKIFQEWFSSEEGWNGVVGRPPTTVEVKEALSSHHLYLYLGHGTGREFLKGDEVQRLYCQAVTILMGCSSGKLIVQGSCDARGMALNYLLSGCPAVVANLWDVTDGDIDRFSIALLKMWLKKDNKLSLSQCVSQCRNACLMKYLIGSAPVVYGMPVYTRTSKQQV